jgi:lipopolysaccharide transport system permease protein
VWGHALVPDLVESNCEAAACHIAHGPNRIGASAAGATWTTARVSMLRTLTDLWRYRGFIIAEVSRQLQVRYLGSVLGASWTLLNPLAMILIYTLVFSRLMGARLPGLDGPFAYAVYICAGLLPWGLFQDHITRSVNLFLDHANLIKKVAFPTSTLPAIVALGVTLDFVLIFAVFLLFLLAAGHPPGPRLLAMLPLLALQLALSSGLGMLVAVLNVFFRDVGHVSAIVLRLWFWLTPIVYPLSILPDWVLPWVQWGNPMTPLVQGYQTILLLGQWPDWRSLWLPGLWSAALLWGGVRLYRARAAEILDEL